MSSSSPSPLRAFFGVDRNAARRSALSNLARHTSHDTVLIATTESNPAVNDTSISKDLDENDIDGLSKVVDDLGGRHLDLVLHGSPGGLDAAGELVFLLRSRDKSIRAIVPNSALSAMTLITLVCDAAIMPDSALLGATDDRDGPQISSDQAADWLAHNCEPTDVDRRIDAAALLFTNDDEARSPITAAHANDLGLPFHVVGQRSGIGAELQPLGEFVDRALRGHAIIKLILNHRGVCYGVEA